MSYNTGPKIVTDGLVLCLDAADRNSYAGSGTTWADLSANGNNGTLINGVGYSSGNRGSLVFDGVNDYVSVSSISVSTFTYQGWVYSTPSSSASDFGYFHTGGTYGLAISEGGNHGFGGGSVAGDFYYYNSSDAVVLNYNLSPNVWVNIASVINGSSKILQLYVNGSLQSSTNVTNTQSSITDFGRYSANIHFFNGRLSNTSVYNRALTAQEIQQNYNALKGRYTTPGSSADKPALSASQIKIADPNATNGTYWYRFSDGGIRSLWTDFTTYAPYSFVMVNRIWSGSQNQYLTTEENVTDLGIIPSNTAPSRHSKLSDVYMNEIIVPNTIRWAIVGNGSIFYRLDDSPQWYSNHGSSRTCSYNRGFYNGYATPSSSPSWQTSFGAWQSCGGAFDSSNAWLSLTGIHTNDGTYFGGYSGSSTFRLTPPFPYSVGGTTNDVWSQNGYVLLSW